MIVEDFDAHARASQREWDVLLAEAPIDDEDRRLGRAARAHCSQRSAV